MKLKFKFANGNPWRRNLPDCTFRGLSLALNMNYRSVCEALGCKCVDGWGIPIDIPDQSVDKMTEDDLPPIEKIIKTFEKYFDTYDLDSIFDNNYSEIMIRAVTGKSSGFDDEYVDPDSAFTINQHVDELMMPPGLYVYWIRPSEKQLQRADCSPDWHTTLVNTRTHTLLDTFDCSDDGLVYGWAKIKESARIQNDSKDPMSWMKYAKYIDRGYFWGKFKPHHWSKEDWLEYIKKVKAKDQSRPNVFKTFPF